VIILQGNIFVELRTNLYLCRRRLISWGEYGTTVKEEKRVMAPMPQWELPHTKVEQALPSRNFKANAYG
jgi:hypothetical protein